MWQFKMVLKQEEICKKFKVSPRFPIFTQKVAISAGVLDGLPIEAVRYPSPYHMTGWWLTTTEYDGNVKTIKPVPCHDIAFNRPDIFKYLALPFGYRFFCGEETDIWFDEKVVSEDNS